MVAAIFCLARPLALKSCIMTERQIPSFDELPKFHEFTGCAWGVWGKDDQLGTVNLLTEAVVAEAVKEVK